MSSGVYVLGVCVGGGGGLVSMGYLSGGGGDFVLSPFVLVSHTNHFATNTNCSKYHIFCSKEGETPRLAQVEQ